VKDDNYVPIHPSSPREQSVDDDDDGSDPLIYSEHDASVNEESIDSDEESDKFDGEYLKRLKARSMPSDVKRMLSGRNIVSNRNLMANKSAQSESSDDHSFTSTIEEGYRKGHQRPRRKKTGEIVNDDMDPADVYAQELKKQNGKKAFTIAGLRKEMENMKKNKTFARESTGSFGNFDDMSPSPMSQYKVKLSRPKKNFRSGTSLGKAIESLERQRPGLATARSIRSLGTTFSDQGLLTGSRRERRRKSGLPRMPETIKEDDHDEEEGMLMVSGVNSDGFDKNIFANPKSGMTGVNTILPNLKLFGNGGISGIKAFKKTFKTKKPTQFANACGGGFLNVERDDEFANNEDGNGIEIMDGCYRDMPIFGQQEHDDDVKYQRANKMLDKMNMKGVLSKLKLPGNRKFGGGIMIDDNDGANYNGSSMGGQL